MAKPTLDILHRRISKLESEVEKLNDINYKLKNKLFTIKVENIKLRRLIRDLQEAAIKFYTEGE